MDRSSSVPLCLRGEMWALSSGDSARSWRTAYTVRSAFLIFKMLEFTMSLTNHQFRLAARPVGLPKPSDWNYAEEPVRDLGPGEVLIKTLYLSLDPAMRGWMNEGRSYVAPVGIGD